MMMWGRHGVTDHKTTRNKQLSRLVGLLMEFAFGDVFAGFLLAKSVINPFFVFCF